MSGIGLFASGYLLGSACGNEVSTGFASFGAYVYDMVGLLDDIHDMLYDYNRVTVLNQPVKGLEQGVDVVEMQTCGRLVKYEHRGSRCLRCQIPCQLDTLVFAA